MTYRAIHPQFVETFVYFGDVPDTIRESLWNYMSYGLQPGGFMTAVLKNDFFSAMARADHTWSGKSFKQLAKWIDTNMPRHMRGSEAAMEQWAAKTDIERRDAMIELRLRPDEFEILAGRAIP